MTTLSPFPCMLKGKDIMGFKRNIPFLGIDPTLCHDTYLNLKEKKTHSKEKNKTPTRDSSGSLPTKENFFLFLYSSDQPGSQPKLNRFFASPPSFLIEEANPFSVFIKAIYSQISRGPHGGQTNRI